MKIAQETLKQQRARWRKRRRARLKASRFICSRCDGFGFIKRKKYLIKKVYSFVYNRCSNCVDGAVK